VSAADTLEGWLELRNMAAGEIVRQFYVLSEDIRPNANYGHLTHLTEYYAPDTMPGRMYFQGSDFVLLYISSPEMTQEALQAAPLLAAIQPETLRSRAGKNNRQYVYGAQGVAFSADIPTGSIDFVEVFLPLTPEEYRRLFYVDPGDFNR
jgi:hypothetical protein